MRESGSLMALGLDPIQPPPRVRERVLAYASSTGPDHDEAKLAQGPSRTRGGGWWIAIAAALLLVLIWQWNDDQLDDQQMTMAQLTAEREQLAEENRRLERANQKLASQIDSLATAEQTYRLSGLEAAPAASARVFVDEPNRRAFVFFRDLPASPGDKDYQLWIIRADKEQPESAGVFDAGADGTAQITVENLPVEVEIKALAVTVEPEGGVPAPTGNMLLLGGHT